MKNNRPPKKSILASGSLTHTFHAIDASQCPRLPDAPQRWAILCEETGARICIKTKANLLRKHAALLGNGDAADWRDYELDRAKLLGVDMSRIAEQMETAVSPASNPDSPGPCARPPARVDAFLKPVNTDANTWKRAVRNAVTRVDPDAIFASLIDQLTAMKPVVVGGEIIEYPDSVARSRVVEFILSHGDGRPSAKDDLQEKKKRESFAEYVGDGVNEDGTVRSKARLRRTLCLDIMDHMGDDEIAEQLAELQARVAKRAA